MVPKAVRKKACILRRWVECSELSSLVEEYPRQHHVDTAVAVIPRVTRRQTHKVSQSATTRSRMKSAKISLPHTLPPDNNYDDEVERSQDSSKEVEQEQSSALPQYEEGTTTHT
ncbi:hypothetical protein FXO37_29053 [Capsicum annuum]|nr:hypothetical protein FXO37_29053 [Capsicum annuum]